MASSRVTPALIHSSWYARAMTWVSNEAKTVKNTILKVVGISDKVAAAVQAEAPTIEAISNLVVPGIGNIEAHIIDVWSACASAVDAAGAAAAANGVSVQLDSGLVQAIKAVLPAVKAKMSPAASSAPPQS